MTKERPLDEDAALSPGPAEAQPAATPEPPAAAPTPAPEGPPPAEPRLSKQEKQEKKLRKRQKDAHRPIDAWERYRALTDVLDEAMELVDLADHKARFALVIMALLNVVLFFIGTRSDLVKEIPAALQPWIGAYVLAYVLIALYFFLQAIESLRPRKSQPQVAYSGETAFQEHPLGLRFYEDILGRDVEAYRRAWREVRLGQLNNELAVQAHALAAINKAKYAALRRLYMGLKLMTLMAVGMVAVTALSTLAKAGKHGRKNTAVLGAPQRLGDVGAREPSGIAVDPGSGYLYLVGDEGSLWELDARGGRRRSLPVRGNLEDVAVVVPESQLLLLVEQPPELVVYDLAAGRETRRLRLDRQALLGEEPGERNAAFEGLAFRPAANGSGRGQLYLAHQRAPAMVVALDFDLQRAPEVLGSEGVHGRWRVPGFTDLTAVTWSAELGRLMVVADKRDRLLLLRADGAVEAEVPLPGEQQEGLAVDADGTLWVADDQNRAVLVFEGAVGALDGVLRGRTVAPSDPLSLGGGGGGAAP